MRSVEIAVATDFFRRGAYIFPVVLLVMITLPIWLYSVLDPERVLGAESREGVVLHVTLTLVMGFGAAVAIFQAQGNLARYFVRPISAARLVTCQFVLSAVTISVMYLVAGALVNLLGADWPLLGPALFLATTLCCALAAIWALEGSVTGQFLGCSATSIPLVIWFSRCYGATVMGDWHSMWLKPTAGEAVSLGLISVVAYLIAISGVNRVRHGDLWDGAAIWVWLERMLTSIRGTAHLANPWQGLLWNNRREKFVPFAACFVTFINLLAIAAWLVGWMPSSELLGFTFVVPIVAMTTVVPLVYGLVAGSCGKEGKQGMKYTLATLPVSDSLIAAALLRSCASALCWCWLSCLIWAAIGLGLVYLHAGSEVIETTLHPEQYQRLAQFVPLVAAVFISWTITALMSTLVATGRPWLWILVLGAVFGSALGISVLKLYMRQPTYEFILTGWFLITGTLSGVGTIAAYVVARRLRLIDWATIAPAAGVWTAVAVATVAIGYRETADISWLWHIIGFLALGILPFAAMPLAVRWNRHR